MTWWDFFKLSRCPWFSGQKAEKEKRGRMRVGISGVESVLGLGWIVALSAEHSSHLGTQQGSETLEYLWLEDLIAQDTRPVCRQWDIWTPGKMAPNGFSFLSFPLETLTAAQKCPSKEYTRHVCFGDHQFERSDREFSGMTVFVSGFRDQQWGLPLTVTQLVTESHIGKNCPPTFPCLWEGNTP